MNIAFDIVNFTIRQMIYFSCILLIGALLLNYSTKIFKFKNLSYRTGLEALFIGAIVAFFISSIPFIGRVLSLFIFLYLIKWFYKESWKKAFLAWLTTVILGFILAIIILTIIDIPILFIPKLTF